MTPETCGRIVGQYFGFDDENAPNVERLASKGFRELFRVRAKGLDLFVKHLAEDTRSIGSSEGSFHAQLAADGFTGFVPCLASVSVPKGELRIYRFEEPLETRIGWGEAGRLIADLHSASQRLSRRPAGGSEPVLAFLHRSNLDEQYRDVVEAASAGPWFTIHGDLRDDNILHTIAGARLVDFEFCRPSHRLLDLASLPCFARVPETLVGRISMDALGTLLDSYAAALPSSNMPSKRLILRAASALNLYLADQLAQLSAASTAHLLDLSKELLHDAEMEPL